MQRGGFVVPISLTQPANHQFCIKRDFCIRTESKSKSKSRSKSKSKSKSKTIPIEIDDILKHLSTKLKILPDLKIKTTIKETVIPELQRIKTNKEPLFIITKEDNNTLKSNYIKRIRQDIKYAKFTYYADAKISKLHKKIFSKLYTQVLNRYTGDIYSSYNTTTYSTLIKYYKYIITFNNDLNEHNCVSLLKSLSSLLKSSSLKSSSLKSLSSKIVKKGGNKIFNYFKSNTDEIVITPSEITEQCENFESNAMFGDEPDIYTHILDKYTAALTINDTDTDTEANEDANRRRKTGLHVSSPSSASINSRKRRAIKLTKEFFLMNANSIFTVNKINITSIPGDTSLQPVNYIQYLTVMYYLKFEKLLWYVTTQLMNYKENIKEFITNQQNYIQSLQPFHKITIYTYTTGFYKIYNIWKTDKSIIHNFRTKFSSDPLYTGCNNLYESFVRAKNVFYYQIRIVLFNKIASVIPGYTKDNFDADFPINHENISLASIKSKIGSSYQTQLDLIFPNNNLKDEDYDNIFILYGGLLNEIIYNAPRIERGKEFIAFRGSNNNYIKNASNNESKGSYNNTRFSSYSINPSSLEGIIYYFYNLPVTDHNPVPNPSVSQMPMDDDDDDDAYYSFNPYRPPDTPEDAQKEYRRLYEVLFTSEAIILFVAPVSQNPYELEILSAENSIVNIQDDDIIKINRYNKDRYDIEEAAEIFKTANTLCSPERLETNLKRIYS